MKNRYPTLTRILSTEMLSMMGEANKKPIEREVEITLTLKEAAEALGYLSGRNKWKIMNDYLDADEQEDVWHNGYSAQDVQRFSTPKGMDGAELIFPNQLAMAAEAAERVGLAREITKERYNCIEQAFENINPAGEYMSGEGEMISIKSSTGITSCTVDAPANKVTLKIKNPEHLINDIVNGVGIFSPDIDPYEAASSDEIKKGIINVAGDYFEVYGELKPEVSDRFDAYPDDDVYSEELKLRISEMGVDEIADAVIEAVDDGRVEDEKDAIELASKLSKVSTKEISRAVIAIHKKEALNLTQRAKDLGKKDE